MYRYGILMLLAGCLLADTVTLRDGRTVDGTYVGGDARSVRILVADKVQTFSLQDVSNIQFGPAAAAPVAVAEPAPVAPLVPASPALRDRPEAAQPSRAMSSGVEIPSGTAIVVSLIDGVDSEKDHLGQTYRASLAEPVLVNGDIVIPRGADVVTKLVDDKESGKLTGRTELTLDVVSVQVNGRMVDIDTATVTRSSGSRTNRSAAVVGGTTVLGTVLGAIAGGGKGAAIGAVSGAGVGTAAQVITKGQRVKIPSETRLTFTLQQPARL